MDHPLERVWRIGWVKKRASEQTIGTPRFHASCDGSSADAAAVATMSRVSGIGCRERDMFRYYPRLFLFVMQLFEYCCAILFTTQIFWYFLEESLCWLFFITNSTVPASVSYGPPILWTIRTPTISFNLSCLSVLLSPTSVRSHNNRWYGSINACEVKDIAMCLRSRGLFMVNKPIGWW